MLYQQIDTVDKSRKSIEWKATLGFLSGTHKTQREEGLTEEKMLQAVIKEIEEAGQVGSVDEPNIYIKGILPMRWGIFKDTGRPDGEPPLVYFGGKTVETIFGFGGSTYHVVGVQGASSTGSRSVTPYLVAHLLEGLDINPQGWNAWFEEEGREHQTFQAVAAASHQLRPPDQNMEFFTNTLLTGKVKHPLFTEDKILKCVLGSPLYVAMAAPYPDDWV